MGDLSLELAWIFAAIVADEGEVLGYERRERRSEVYPIMVPLLLAFFLPSLHYLENLQPSHRC